MTFTRPAPQVLTRKFAGELVQTDDHTLKGRAVPYDVVADVVDVDPAGNVVAFREGFRAGAFHNQVNSGEYARIVLVDGHQGQKLGVARGLEDADGGLDVVFRIKPSAVNDVSMLLEEGVRDLSVGFVAVRGGTTRADDGTLWRTRAYLDHVALEAEGAYPGAEVLAFRNGDAHAAAAAESASYVSGVEELGRWLETEAHRWDHLRSS